MDYTVTTSAIDEMQADISLQQLAVETDTTDIISFFEGESIGIKGFTPNEQDVLNIMHSIN